MFKKCHLIRPRGVKTWGIPFMELLVHVELKLYRQKQVWKVFNAASCCRDIYTRRYEWKYLGLNIYTLSKHICARKNVWRSRTYYILYFGTTKHSCTYAARRFPWYHKLGQKKYFK